MKRFQLTSYLCNFWLVVWNPWEAQSFGITRHCWVSQIHHQCSFIIRHVKGYCESNKKPHIVYLAKGQEEHGREK